LAQYFAYDRTVESLYGRLKLLKEDGDLNKLQEKVLNVLDEDHEVIAGELQ